MKFISYIYTLFLHCFCWLLVKFCKVGGEEKLYTGVFGYYVQQPFSWHDVNRTLRQPFTYFINTWRRLRVRSRERVSFIGVWTRRSKIGSSKENNGECKYWYRFSLDEPILDQIGSYIGEHHLIMWCYLEATSRVNKRPQWLSKHSTDVTSWRRLLNVMAKCVG